MNKNRKSQKGFTLILSLVLLLVMSLMGGAAMAVVGWWSGYKLGGVLSLFSAEFLEKAGFQNYWQLTFLILGILIILMNIGLMFVDEVGSLERQESKK